MLWIEKHPDGRRLYFRDRRIHHYTAGLGLIGIGIAMILRDLADVREALRRD